MPSILVPAPFLLAALALVAALLLALPAAGGEPAEAPSLFFVAAYRPGPHWLEGKPVFQQPLEAHGAYMAELHAAGKLIEGGPFLDHTGGISIFRVASEEEAEAILADDPAVTSGVMAADLKPWMRIDWSAFRARREREGGEGQD